MTKNNCFLLPLLRIIPFVYIAYYYYFCLFSSTSMYVMNNFSLLFAYWCVGKSCLDHLFHDDFLMVFIPCFDSDFMEINFGSYFSSTAGMIVLLGLLYITIYGSIHCMHFLSRNVLFDLSSNMSFIAFLGGVSLSGLRICPSKFHLLLVTSIDTGFELAFFHIISSF